jgi:hypothetical protein
MLNSRVFNNAPDSIELAKKREKEGLKCKMEHFGHMDEKPALLLDILEYQWNKSGLKPCFGPQPVTRLAAESFHL